MPFEALEDLGHEVLADGVRAAQRLKGGPGPDDDLVLLASARNIGDCYFRDKSLKLTAIAV